MQAGPSASQSFRQLSVTGHHRQNSTNASMCLSVFFRAPFLSLNLPLPWCLPLAAPSPLLSFQNTLHACREVFGAQAGPGNSTTQTELQALFDIIGTPHWADVEALQSPAWRKYLQRLPGKAPTLYRYPPLHVLLLCCMVGISVLTPCMLLCTGFWSITHRHKYRYCSLEQFRLPNNKVRA